MPISLAQGSSGAADPIAKLDSVLVTGTAVGRETARTVPHSVSVITAADIARSTALSLGDLLSREANLNLQSYFGTGGYSTIDIRGSGATATSNTLVLVDGVPLNEVDLSGADLSSVPLAQIERIEVLRGGGAVRYGNGAVGGVINIVTRRAQPEQASYELLAGLGSYRTRELRANASIGLEQAAGSINLGQLDSDGYRQNGFSDARDISAELRLFPHAAPTELDGYLRYSWHRSDSGLPGPVSAESFAGSSAQRRASNAPHDNASVDDRRYTAGASAAFGSAGLLSLQSSYRDRSNAYVIGYSPIIPIEEQRSQITSKTWDYLATYDQSFRAFGFKHDFSIGVQALSADYLRTENGQFVVDSSTRRSGKVESRAAYVTARLRASEQIVLSGGIRFNRYESLAGDERYTREGCRTVFETIFVDIDPGSGVTWVPVRVPRQVGCVDAYRLHGQQGGTWRNRGAELGLTWEPSPEFTGFASATLNFRNPNVDELMLAAPDLRPQTGRTFEAGIRYSAGQSLELSVAVFQTKTDDEIYYGYDPATGSGVNRNYELPTSRTGFELEARWRASPTLALRANLGHVAARFDGSGAAVPLVPALNANAELQWRFAPWAQWLLSGRYVGQQYDGNDPLNTQYPQLPAYVVVDTALRIEQGGVIVTAGIRNLLNEVYSTVAYSNLYYPMPERSFYLQLRASF